MNEVSRDQQDPAQQVAEVRDILHNRGSHTCEATLLRIRRVIDPPAAGTAVEKDPRGWVVFEDREFPVDDDGTAWERHDDPEVDR